MPKRSPIWPVIFCCLPLCGGCLSSSRLDTVVQRTLTREAGADVAASSNSVADAFAGRAPTNELPTAIELDAPSVLRLATRYSRALQTQREQLYLSGVATLATRRDFGPQCSGTLEYLFAHNDDGTDLHTLTASLKASQILPTGGTLSLSGQGHRPTTGSASNNTATTTYDSTASVELRQPLLAGAGYTASHERAIQAEQDLMYALRGFALSRQDFAISILTTYYNLLMQKAVLANTRLNVQQSAFLRRRSEAMFKIRLAPALDVMRAQQQELSASNSLSMAESDFDVALNRFLVQLGVPPTPRVTMTGTVPELRPVALAPAQGLALALTRRLDLLTARDRVADAARRLRTARQNLLPQADAFGRADYTAPAADALTAQDYEQNLSAGVTLQLPLDQRAERDAVKKAALALDAARRDLDEKQDTIRVEISESFRRLETQALSAQIEARNTDLAKRRADYAVLRFKNGEVSNRDVVEAQTELLNARNAYVQALVAYELQRLQLLRDVGLLDVAADGMWIERAPPGA